MVAGSTSPPAPDARRRCHEPAPAGKNAGGGGADPGAPAMPPYDVGQDLDADESRVLERLAELIHDIDPNIPTTAVQPDRTLWEIGYDSLALVALRMGVKRVFGPHIQAVHWLRLHSELPRIGCFVRFLAASGAKG